MRSLFIALCICIFIAIVGIADAQDYDTRAITSTNTPASITITPGDPTIEIGTAVYFKAAVRNAKGKTVTAKVTWTLADSSCGTLTKTGIFKAGRLIGAFQNAITASVTLPDKSLLTTASNITVRLPYSGVFLGEYTGDSTGYISFISTKTTFKGMLINAASGDVVKLSGKVDKNGNITAKTKIGSGTLEIQGQITNDGISGSWINTFLDEANQSVQEQCTFASDRSDMPSAGAYIGTMTGKNTKGALCLMLWETGEVVISYIMNIQGEVYNGVTVGSWYSDRADVSDEMNIGFSGAIKGRTISGTWESLDLEGNLLFTGKWSTTKM